MLMLAYFVYMHIRRQPCVFWYTTRRHVAFRLHPLSKGNIPGAAKPIGIMAGTNPQDTIKTQAKETPTSTLTLALYPKRPSNGNIR